MSKRKDSCQEFKTAPQLKSIIISEIEMQTSSNIW